jgi:N utilization substance protein B
MEVGGTRREDAQMSMLEDMALEPDMSAYAERVIDGVIKHRARIDNDLSSYVREYDYSRLAAIDRNILRIGAFELELVPEMPPAVSINEAIEIAKKYSTAESGRFVNGVLARMLKDTGKANWDPSKAPKEFQEEILREPEVVPELEVVDEDSEEGKDARRFGQWTIREGDDERTDS